MVSQFDVNPDTGAGKFAASNIGQSIIETPGAISSGFGKIGIPDVILIPVPDMSTNATGAQRLTQGVGKLAQGLAGTVILNSVLQLEVDKGNVITARRVDGGYALTQRGSKHDDRAYIRVLLTGPLRFLTTQIISYLSDNKTTPITFLSRTVRLARTQIESLKIVASSERRQAIMLDIIFRQLRSFQDDAIANILNAGAALMLPFLLNDENLYSSARSTNRTGNLIGVGLSDLLGAPA